MPTYKVRFFSAQHSKRGQGARVAYFESLSEAEAFASTQRLYSAPARVETVEALTPEQAKVVNRVITGRVA